MDRSLPGGWRWLCGGRAGGNGEQAEAADVQRRSVSSLSDLRCCRCCRFCLLWLPYLPYLPYLLCLLCLLCLPRSLAPSKSIHPPPPLSASSRALLRKYRLPRSTGHGILLIHHQDSPRPNESTPGDPRGPKICTDPVQSFNAFLLRALFVSDDHEPRWFARQRHGKLVFLSVHGPFLGRGHQTARQQGWQEARADLLQGPRPSSPGL